MQIRNLFILSRNCTKKQNEYLRDRLLRKISGYQEEIEKLKDTYDQNKQKIAALEDKNRQLEEGKKYQTAEEIERKPTRKSRPTKTNWKRAKN